MSVSLLYYEKRTLGLLKYKYMGSNIDHCYQHKGSNETPVFKMQQIDVYRGFGNIQTKMVKNWFLYFGFWNGKNLTVAHSRRI